MAFSKSNLSIHAAKMNCLSRCLESEAPATYMLDFLDKLRSMGWSDEDIERVEAAVIPLLGKAKFASHTDAADATVTAS